MNVISVVIRHSPPHSVNISRTHTFQFENKVVVAVNKEFTCNHLVNIISVGIHHLPPHL
jgi:hypothetical protein